MCEFHMQEFVDEVDEDEIDIVSERLAQKHKAARRRRQTHLHQQRLIRIAEMPRYNPRVWVSERFDEKSWEWFEKPYAVRGHNSNRSKFGKRRSNRTVRRNRNEIFTGNQYRKMFDYWWEVY